MFGVPRFKIFLATSIILFLAFSFCLLCVLVSFIRFQFIGNFFHF